MNAIEGINGPECRGELVILNDTGNGKLSLTDNEINRINFADSVL